MQFLMYFTKFKQGLNSKYVCQHELYDFLFSPGVHIYAGLVDIIIMNESLLSIGVGIDVKF